MATEADIASDAAFFTKYQARQNAAFQALLDRMDASFRDRIASGEIKPPKIGRDRHDNKVWFGQEIANSLGVTLL